MTGDEIGAEAEARNGNSRNSLRLTEFAAACEDKTSDDQRAGDRIRTGDVQLGKLAFYH